jgi:hypothetical protein
MNSIARRVLDATVRDMPIEKDLASGARSSFGRAATSLVVIRNRLIAYAVFAYADNVCGKSMTGAGPRTSGVRFSTFRGNLAADFLQMADNANTDTTVACGRAATRAAPEDVSTGC